MLIRRCAVAGSCMEVAVRLAAVRLAEANALVANVVVETVTFTLPIF